MVHQAIAVDPMGCNNVEVLQLDWIEVACASANNRHFNISSIMYGSEAAGEVYYKDSTDQPGSGIQRHTLLNSPQRGLANITPQQLILWVVTIFCQARKHLTCMLYFITY